MKVQKKLIAAAIAGALLAMAPGAFAQTLRVANQGDALSMDPHSLNESLQLSVDSNAYEALVGWNKKLEMVPMLATSWKQTSPTVWRFELRKGVQFYDGTPFTADDVVFTMGRIMADGSDMKSYGTDVKETRKIDDHTIEIETKAPQPILPRILSQVYIMSKKWCEANNAVKPVDRRKGVENTASFKTNGTGPFHVRERQPGVRTVFRATGARSRATPRKSSSPPSPTRPPAWPRCCRARSTSWSRCPSRTWPASTPTPAPTRWWGPSCAPSSWAWTRSATSCCSPT